MLSQLPPKRRQLIIVELLKSDISRAKMVCDKGENFELGDHHSLEEKSVGNDLSIETLFGDYLFHN